MSPRALLRLLGLCNLVAGALFTLAPSRLLGPLDGAHTTAAALLATCLGVLLVAIGAGAFVVGDHAGRPYLWIFGVGVKLVGALIWAAAAQDTGVVPLWAGAAADGTLALVIGGCLMTPRRPQS